MSEDTQNDSNSSDVEKAVVDPMPVSLNGGRQSYKPGARVGVPGYSITNGYILPNDSDARLLGAARYKLYSENLANIAIIGTAVRYYLDLVADAGWSFEPADDSAEAEEIANFFTDVFEQMETSMKRVFRRASMYKYYGFSCQEFTIMSREDGRIGLVDIEPVPQKTVERWDVDNRGVVRGIIQRNPNTGQEIYIDRRKLFYVYDDSLSDSPEGLGIFRHMTRTAASVKRFEDLEHWGFETDLQGVPVGRAPLSELDEQVANGTITAADRTRAKAVMENFIENHIRGPNTGIVLDSRTYESKDESERASSALLWDVELLKAEGGSHAAINEAIKRKTYELARLVGVEHILIGADGGGSMALHSSSTRRLHGMVNSCLDELCDGMQKQPVKLLGRLNGIRAELMPKIRHEKIEYRSVEEVVSALEGLSRAGAPLMPGDPAVNEVRELVGLSRAEDEGISLSEALLMTDPTTIGNEDAGAMLRGRDASVRRPMEALRELVTYIDGNKLPETVESD